MQTRILWTGDISTNLNLGGLIGKKNYMGLKSVFLSDEIQREKTSYVIDPQLYRAEYTLNG
jgi:hypothetical protein